MADVLRMIQALAEPNRLAIFECIRECGGVSAFDTQTGDCGSDDESCISACDVRCRIPCSPSSMSRHFTTLREAGLIETERRGRKLFATVRPEALETLREFFEARESAPNAG